jgi:tellurite methyltransferase
MSVAPESAIVAFHQDDEAAWVAELACGHSQHVRHRPPLELRPWVTSNEGRQARVGALLPCHLCRMPKLPAGLIEYKRTAVFDTKSTPAGLRKAHSTKGGVWGELVVTCGRVLYVLEAPEQTSFVLHPGVPGAIAPEMLHHVEPHDGARFYVRFLRAPG